MPYFPGSSTSPAWGRQLVGTEVPSLPGFHQPESVKTDRNLLTAIPRTLKEFAFLLSPLALPAACWAQGGYSLLPGKVVIDSREHWERWRSAAGTIRISDEGVMPTFVRKSTRLETDGGETVVPGINAVLNAADFGGGIRDAGSNALDAANLMDGRMDTWWEPDRADLLEDWWVQIDLGRTVSATRIVLEFVGEGLGDPFLHFKVTTSQGERPVEPMLFRTRFTTDRPVKNERRFEIDLTRQLATKWPDVAGDFSGDVIRYVGVGITDSDFGKGREVSPGTYEDLPPEQRGDILYFREDARGNRDPLDGREDWDRLAGSGMQGPVIHYRRERPRLAEVEVWAIGDNIGTGVLDRGGKVTSSDNSGSEMAVVDGDYFGKVPHWSTNAYFDPDKLLPWDPPDLERSLFIDLGGSYFLDNIRVLHAAGTFTAPFPTYRIQVSDGSTHADGELAWKTVGSFENLASGNRYNDLKFPLAKVEHVAFTFGLGDWFVSDRSGLSEMQFFGEGYMPESRISSAFEGESSFIEIAGTPRNLTTIQWDADVPPGTDLILQTRTGNTFQTKTHYYQKNGEKYPGTDEEAAEAYASDKKYFGENAVGRAVVEKVPGSEWSGWSQPYFSSGDRISSPSPRKYAALRATFLTEVPMAAASLRTVELNFATPVAKSIIGEVLPSRLKTLGARQELSYFVRSAFDGESLGFDEILIEAPEGIAMTFERAEVNVTGEPAVRYVTGSAGFEVVRNDADSLWLRLPAPVKTTRGSALVEVRYETTVFGYNTFFTGSLGHSGFDGSWQRVDDGDANGFEDSETTVVLALEQGTLLGDLEMDGSFTPNGDGINDVMEVGFSLLRLGSPVPVRVEVYDLRGRLAARLSGEARTAGRHSLTWNGRCASGGIVPPGIYMLRIRIVPDSEDLRNSVHRLVRVVY